MQDLNPKEYLKLWQQTGVEPSLSQINTLGKMYQSPQEALANFFAKALTLALEQDDPLWVENLLLSCLATTLKKSEKTGRWARLATNEASSFPWFFGVNEALRNAVFKTSGVNKQSAQVLVHCIHQNLNDFRTTRLKNPSKRSKVTSLLLSIKNLHDKDQPFPSSFGLTEVEPIVSFLTDKEKVDFFTALLQFDCTVPQFDFVVKHLKQYNLALPQDDTVYRHVLYGMISKENKFSDLHKQQALEIVFTDKKRRNETIRSFLINNTERGDPTSEVFPLLDKFCSLLPKEDILPLIKCILRAPLPVKALPPFLKAHWEHHQISQELKPSLLLKIKRILFSSRTMPHSIPVPSLDHPQSLNPQHPSPSPKRKM